ncbi:MAG TPA: NADH-quinone oxidoreductase subunit J [Syntrophorhabdaceae bacterium]|jgi:NADH-quinone oxidoreductase subunit J
MNILFFVAGGVAVVSTIMVVTCSHAVHALLYLVVSLLSTGLIFYVLGAPFAATLEVIIYAGAIMVLFVFVVMMLDLGHAREGGRKNRILPLFAGPVILSSVLLAEIAYAIIKGMERPYPVQMVSPGEVAAELYGPYALGIEIASMLLLAGLAAAFHLARHHKERPAGEDKRR